MMRSIIIAVLSQGRKAVRLLFVGLGAADEPAGDGRRTGGHSQVCQPLSTVRRQRLASPNPPKVDPTGPPIHTPPKRTKRTAAEEQIKVA